MSTSPHADQQLLPSEVPVGCYVFDTRSAVWVQVTGKPVTFCGLTVMPVLEGFDVPVMFDTDKRIPVCFAT
jgi:hypothetical protein